MPASATETTRGGLFASTRWTMVLDAGESQTPPDQALNALSELCRIYCRPIFLFLRRQGSNPQDAQDLTQGFFAHLIESRAYARADPEKGRFPSDEETFLKLSSRSGVFEIGRFFSNGRSIAPRITTRRQIFYEIPRSRIDNVDLNFTLDTPDASV